MQVNEVSGYTLKPREKKLIDQFFKNEDAAGIDFRKSNIGLEITTTGDDRWKITGFRTTIAEIDFGKRIFKKGNKIGGNMSQTLLNYVTKAAKSGRLKDEGFLNESRDDDTYGALGGNVAGMLKRYENVPSKDADMIEKAIDANIDSIKQSGGVSRRVDKWMVDAAKKAKIKPEDLENLINDELFEILSESKVVTKKARLISFSQKMNEAKNGKKIKELEKDAAKLKKEYDKAKKDYDKDKDDESLEAAYINAEEKLKRVATAIRLERSK